MRSLESSKEKSRRKHLAKFSKDPISKHLLFQFADQLFRSHHPERQTDQILHLLDVYGIPNSFSFSQRSFLFLFRYLATQLPKVAIFLSQAVLRCIFRAVIQTKRVTTKAHAKYCRYYHFDLHFHAVAENAIGYADAPQYVKQNIEALANPAVAGNSIKISSLAPNIEPLAGQTTLEHLKGRLRTVYRAAKRHNKSVYLDMENYTLCYVTFSLFIQLLEEEEFHSLTAGITLQSYLPDSWDLLKKLVFFAKKRTQMGGAPIQIRLVKGAYLSQEQIVASKEGWPQAPFTRKEESDALFKKMLLFVVENNHTPYAHLSIASHNVFDIAFALYLKGEKKLKDDVSFAILQGMAPTVGRTLTLLNQKVAIYSPTVAPKNFSKAIPFLARRLEENTKQEHFLYASFSMHPQSQTWEAHRQAFLHSLERQSKVDCLTRRSQNRLSDPAPFCATTPFDTTPKTDFSLPPNIKWAQTVQKSCITVKHKTIPLVFCGKEQSVGTEHTKFRLYNYYTADADMIKTALGFASRAVSDWQSLTLETRADLLLTVANQLQLHRGACIRAMMLATQKPFKEADLEVSAAIDLLLYYRESAIKLLSIKDLEFSARGVFCVVTFWDSPLLWAVNGISASLVNGNCVLFAPHQESVWVSFILANLFWQAGVSKNVLQFMPCSIETLAATVQSTEMDGMVFTGEAKTAQSFLKERPDLHLLGTTFGKNSIILSDMADKTQAIQGIIQSAFIYSGQKQHRACLLICLAPVYDDAHFLQQLKAAALSLKMGLATDFEAAITPLMTPFSESVQSLLTLEKGESWLVQPQIDHKSNRCSIGIKLGVKKGSLAHSHLPFFPILYVMRATHLQEAIALANSTPYGLSTAIYTLDEREMLQWKRGAFAGNYYINRPLDNPLPLRQPFGGIKMSGFGPPAKIGSPNYLTLFSTQKQISIPKEKATVNPWVNQLSKVVEKIDLTAEMLGTWYASTTSYAFWWQQFKRRIDLGKVVGEDNFLSYAPLTKILLRIQEGDQPIDYCRIFAASLTTHAKMRISWDPKNKKEFIPVDWEKILPICTLVEEDHETFLTSTAKFRPNMLRLLQKGSKEIYAKTTPVPVIDAPVLANGRIELLRYLREESLSIHYERYGNCGLREEELRKPIL